MKKLFLFITALVLSISTFAQNGNVTLKGDVNNDGSVSVTDVTMVISHILGKTPEGFNKDAADVNGDKSISVTDVTMMINIILKGGSQPADYYVGWTNGTKSAFAALSDSDIINGATGYSISTTPTYTRTFGDNNIFYLLYQTSKVPTQMIFTSQGTGQTINIINDNTCPHSDVVIDGVTYKIFGDRAPSGYDPTDYITVVFSEPVITTPDYYVGWTNGKKSDFAALSDADIINGATGYSISTTPTYTRAYGNNNIFYLLYQTSKTPTKIIFTSQGTDMEQNINSDNTCPHSDVTIDGTVYKVFGMRMTASADPTNTITLRFN